MIYIPVSIGELFDKISILEIKILHIQDPNKLLNIKKELGHLTELAKRYKFFIHPEVLISLKHVNQKLWNIESHIRQKELKQEFDEEFIQLARSVYINNDERASLKKQINLISHSELMEEKEY